MALYPYVATLAVDPQTLEKAAGATGTIYDPEDTSFASPLTASDETGNPIPLTSNNDGVLPSFYSTEPAVNWRSGSYVFPLVTSMPLPGPQGQPGDPGRDGQDGLPGVNAVPTAEAVATYATTPGNPVNTALSATVASERDAITQPARGAVMFSLDDGRAQNTELVAVHDALRQKITLAITSDWVDDPGRLTSAQILAYHQAGHEIANHSTTHANYISATPAVRAYESDTCSQFIYDLTGRRPSTFVYPQGAWNTASDQELYTRFRSWALTASSTTNAPLTYPLGDTFPRFYRLDLDSPANLDRAKELVRMAAYAPIVVSFYCHWTNQPGTLTTAQYQSIAQLAYDLNVPAVLPRDAFGRESYLLDPSFESPSGNVWMSTNTGAATSLRVAATPDAGISGGYAKALNATHPDTAKVVQGVNLTPGTWRMSGRVKLLSGNLITNDFGITARYRRADESALSIQTVYPTLSANGVWARFAFDLTVPVLTRLAYLELFNTPGATNNRSGVVLVDHLDLRPAEHGDFG